MIAENYIEGARVYHSVAQILPNASTTKLAFDSERWDSEAIHDPITNNSRLTCKTMGKYLIIANISIESNGVGRRSVQIKLNDTTYIAAEEWDTNQIFATRGCILTIHELAVNDFLEVAVYQNSGGNLNAEALSAHSPEFMMERVG